MKLFASIRFLGLFVAALSSQSTKQCASIEVRKEWRALSTTERKNWIEAVNCLSRTPRSGNLNPPLNTASYSESYDQIAPATENSMYYDELVYVHMDLNPIIHFTGLFFPWHRLYVHQWTNALRSQCGYKGVAPYAADFDNSSMWDNDPESGLGGFGDPDDDNVLKTGGLNLSLAYPVHHKLRRKYSPYPGFGGFSNVSANSTFNLQEVSNLLAQPEGNYTAFQYYMEQIVGMHSAIHGIMGGDLAGLCPKGSSNTSACPIEGAPTFSANEPLFHMHHGNVDRLWWLWQEKSEINKDAFHGGSIQNMSALADFPNGQAPWLNKTNMIPSAGMYESYSIGEVMDTRSWPLCYVYE
ncbi:Di-copper centre-containing protein [Ceratobasidium sp. AG-I]|nr:Di-copper centre-containing protein [Ceratobasidium sp. AG-I]